MSMPSPEKRPFRPARSSDGRGVPFHFVLAFPIGFLISVAIDKWTGVFLGPIPIVAILLVFGRWPRLLEYIEPGLGRFRRKGYLKISRDETKELTSRFGAQAVKRLPPRSEMLDVPGADDPDEYLWLRGVFASRYWDCDPVCFDLYVAGYKNLTREQMDLIVARVDPWLISSIPPLDSWSPIEVFKRGGEYGVIAAYLRDTMGIALPNAEAGDKDQAPTPVPEAPPRRENAA